MVKTPTANERRKLRYATDPEYRAHCRELNKKARLRFYEKNPDYHNAMYRKHIAKRKQYLASNKELIEKRRLDYRESNRERLNEADRQRRNSWPFWKKRYEKSLEKANRNGVEVTDRESLIAYYRQIFTQDAAICDYCRGVFAIREIVIDHKQPYAKGGRHVVTNLTTSCYPCNRRKNATPYDKWISMSR